MTMNKWIPILLGFLITILALTTFLFPTSSAVQVIERLENLSYDLRLKLHFLTHQINPQIAIVDIDDKSLKEEGHWPWPRKKLATLVDTLRNDGAVVIAFDIFFSEKEENIYETLIKQLEKKPFYSKTIQDYLLKTAEVEDGDTILAKSLTNLDTVGAITFLPEATFINQEPRIIPPLQTSEDLSLYDSSGYITNIPIIQNANKGEGFINIFSDSDGIIRHAPIVLEYKKRIYPSLSLLAVSLYLMQPISLVINKYNKNYELEGVKLGNVIIPTNEKGEVLIPFVGTSYTFPFYSATDVLHHKIPTDALLGKIVLIGSSATGLGDLHPTAIQNPFPGVEVQASIMNGMLQNKFSQKPYWTVGLNIVVIFILGILVSLIFPFYGARLIGTTIVLFPPILLLINNYVWQRTGFILPWVLQFLTISAIAIMNMIYGYLFESRRREKLKAIFGQYVPAKHIDEMLKKTSNFGMSGEDRMMTVLFADIRSFTTISEKMSAQELVHLLNLYLTPMTEIIFNCRGTIDKYVGDLIMAFWGAPLRDPKHATNGITAAIEMQRSLKNLNANVFTELDIPPIHIGIGLNTGTMSIGDMGSKFRRNYTVLGDAVNLGSRIESLTKFYGVEIMVSEFTHENQPSFIFRKLDIVKVKGKDEGVGIYEVIGYQKEMTETLKKELEEYNIALEYYINRQWDLAETAFNNLHQINEQTKIYKIYLERIAEYKNTPPPEDWQGIYTHTSK